MLAKAASASSHHSLLLDSENHAAFLLSLGALFPGFCQFSLAGLSRDVAERNEAGRILMDVANESAAEAGIWVMPSP